MTETDPSPGDATELALREALEEAEVAFRNAMPLKRPAALARLLQKGAVRFRGGYAYSPGSVAAPPFQMIIG